MSLNVNFGNTTNTDTRKNQQYPPSVYYYPTRPVGRDQVNISNKSQQRDNNSNYAPQQKMMPRPVQKSGFKLPSIQTMLGIASSAVVILFFGKQIYDQSKIERNGRKMAKAIAENAKKVADEAAKKAGGKVSDTISDISKNSGDVKDAILSCTDPILQRAAANEYAKGPMVMSTKRINDILSLGNLKDAKPNEIDLKKAIDIMDKKIVGMEEVKEEILDFLVQQNYNIRNGINPEKPLVLCLNGPAGTGKTTVSEVLSEAMGMHYKKISLAGASGKAPIKGYEAVYTGASSGGVAQGQLEGGTRRVLYCLDEAEKSASSTYNGKVEDTLLSLFDDQCKFVDDNLDVPIDVSQSIFVLTTNEFEKLSTPLKNRVRKIEIAPYGVDIKAKIAELKLTNALKKSKLGEDVVKVNSEAYKTIAEMTKDEGGRETTRNVDTLIKKLIDRVELGENEGKVINVTSDFVKKELGPVTEKVSIKDRILNAISKKANTETIQK